MEKSKTSEQNNFRRTLVFDLQDEEVIKDYLHPGKRSRWEVLKRLYQPVRKDKKLTFYHIVYGLSAGLLALLSAFILQFIIPIMEKLLGQGVDSLQGAQELLVPIAIYSLIYLLLNILAIQVEERSGAKFTAIRMGEVSTICQKTTRMEIGLMDNARFRNQLGNYFDPLMQTGQGMEGIYNKVFTSSKSVVAVFLLSFLLARIHILILLVTFLVILLVTYADYRYGLAHRAKMADFSANDRKYDNLLERAQDFQYGKDVRVYKMDKPLLERAQEIIHKDFLLQKELRSKKRPSSLLKGFALSLLQVVILYFLFRGYIGQEFSLAFLVMILSVLTLFTSEMFQVSQMIAFVYEQSISLDYLYDFLDADLYVEGGQDFPASFQEPADIVFEDVWFRYPGSEDWVLEGVNLTIKEGETLALVGVNGAGKTTLSNLLCGLYTPERGKITIGGYDLQSFSKEALQDYVAVVLQDFEPLALTVKENVAAASEHIDEERVVEVLKQVGLYDKIESFEKGIDSTMLRVLEDDGLVLSGGENQKLSIARAMYRENAKVLILDEPTSALDALAEQAIYQDFAQIMGGKTGIFISHRLASTRFCDKIALLDGGKISQVGSHEDLLQEDGLYQKLYTTQASYYRKEGHDEKQA